MFRKSFVLSGLRISAVVCLFVVTTIAVFNLSGCGGSSSPVSIAVTASAATVDATDAVTLTATVTNDKTPGGVTWSVSGGGTLSNQTTGGATYTAPAASSSALTVTVTATSVADATKTGTTTLTVPAAPAITTGALAAGSVGTPYSQTMAASGGIAPYAWTLTSGTLPACLTMNSAGVISGTPTASCVGTTNLTFKVTDSGSATPLSATSASLGLTINAAPAITFTGSMPGTATYASSSPYVGFATATGGSGALTYSYSGSLPPGLILMSTSNGEIGGTPTAVGTFAFTMKAADAFGDSNTQAYSITVSYSPVKVTAATLPTGYVGSTYTATTLAATGGSGAGYTWALASGSALPAGMNLSAAGVITGKPTATTPTSFTVTATDSASNTGNGTLSITINPAVSVTTGTTLPAGYVGSNYSQTIAATGGSGTGYTWALASGSNPPAGLSLSAAGVLSGKPATAGGPTSFTVTATDSVGNTANATFSITVNAGVSINSITLPTGYPGTAYTPTTLTATGGTGTFTNWSWVAASGSSLPAGLGISTAGVISGNPTNAGTASVVSSVVVTATDSVGNTGSITLPVTIQATLAISTGATLPGGTVSGAYSQTLGATGGSGGYSWTTNPAGTASLAALNLTLSSSGVVSGTPASQGTATFAATVTDSASLTANVTFSVTVSNALTVSTSSLPAAYSGTAYSQTLAAAGGSGTGYTWSLSAPGNLASFNLSLSAAGAITGTPSSSGTATFTAKVTDSASNTATAPLTITVYNALTLPAPNPSSLPSTGTTGAAYTGTITASGGSGAYTWTVTGLPSDGLSSSSSGGTLSISGTPGSAATVSFTAKVTDTATGLIEGPFTYSIVVSNPPPLTLPTPNPTSLPSATATQSYTGFINATGGVGPNYTFTVNGGSIPTNGTQVAISNGITVSNTGGNTLTVGGTPTTTATVTLTNVMVTDSASNTSSPVTYSIAVNSAGSQVSGTINLNNNCNGSSVPAITVSINTSPVQNATTDSNGNFSFASIPNGTYTITPSITGPSSVFYPATQSVTVTNGTVSGYNFSAALGYTVSGNVSYPSPTKTGQVYLSLTGNNCGNGGPGTSITEAQLTSGGAFTIRGVPPGTYTLSAWMDNLGDGAQNASNPMGSGLSGGVVVSSSNVTGANVMLVDPAAVSLSGTAPTLKAVSPANQAVIIVFNAIENSSKVEKPASYTVQWSTSSVWSASSGFGTVTGSKSFPATGTKGGPSMLSGLTNGQVYYFSVQGVAGSSTSSFSSVFGPVTIGALTGGNTVSGTVTFSETATGPLYVGFFDNNSNNVYGTVVGGQASPPTSPATYTVQVPNGSSYFFFGFLDQNNNGLIDTGDVSNTGEGNDKSGLSITGPMTENLTLPTANSTATVTTQYQSNTNDNGGTPNTSTSYSLYFTVRAGIKLPVAVTLTSGPNVIDPVDLGACTDCGNPQFQYNAGIGSDVPTVGQAYAFNVTYSDGTVDNGTVTGAVTGVLTSSQLATSLAPQGTGGSTTPTFTWTYPASASSYIYSFYICCASNGDIWDIPGNNSNLKGFTSSISPSITWGTDPTGDSSNIPSPSSLTTGTTYNWQIQAQDSNGNSAQTQVYYIP